MENRDNNAPSSVEEETNNSNNNGANDSFGCEEEEEMVQEATDNICRQGGDIVVESGREDSTVLDHRKKRGRPRKIVQLGDEACGPTRVAVGRMGEKRGRGRPRGSGKLQMLAAMGGGYVYPKQHTNGQHIWVTNDTGGLAADSVGGNFNPSAVTVHRGEDIVEKVLSFSQRGIQAISVISGVGPISVVDLRSSGPFVGCPFGGSITRYEGYFELLTLNGVLSLTDTGCVPRKTEFLSVTMAYPDGRVFGGSVGGCLFAAAPVQIILGTLRLSTKKHIPKRQFIEPLTHPVPSTPTVTISRNLDTPIVPTPENKAPMNSIVTPQLSPQSPSEADNIMDDKTENCASPEKSDQNASQPLDHVSSESQPDEINDDVHEMGS